MKQVREPGKRIQLQEVVTMAEVDGPEPEPVVYAVSLGTYARAHLNRVRTLLPAASMLLLSALLLLTVIIVGLSRIDVFDVSEGTHPVFEVQRDYHSIVPFEVSSRLGYSFPPDERAAARLQKAMSDMELKPGDPAAGPKLPSAWWAENIFLLFSFSAGICLSLRTGYNWFKRMRPVHVVPLTRANTADLPASDSLVRGSTEPEQVKEAVLLRSAAGAQEKQEEQLLRATAGRRFKNDDCV